MVEIKNELKEWKLVIKQCEEEQLKKNYNINEYDDFSINSIEEYKILKDKDDERNIHILKVEKNMNKYKKEILYKILLGFLLFLSFIYSIVDVIRKK